MEAMDVGLQETENAAVIHAFAEMK